MKGEGSHTSDSDSESASSHRTSDSESTSTCSYSSSSSSACKRKRKRRRRSSEHENENGRRSHSKKRSKNDHRNIELKKSGSSREDATKEKTKKCSRRRSATKSTCESSYSEDEERIYKKKRKEKEKRKKNKLKKKNKGEINQQKEACNLEVLHESVCIAGRRYEENSALQAMANAKEQQKAIIQQQAELAKARLASGELQRARNEQMKMQDLYGTVDWSVMLCKDDGAEKVDVMRYRSIVGSLMFLIATRSSVAYGVSLVSRAKKKLRKEKRILERTVATGRKLASLDERETARMDAFRIAVGLPTAEAQRQAEWRAYATESLAELSEAQKSVKSTSRHSKVIGPSLPRS